MFKQPNGKSSNWYCCYYNKGRAVRVTTRTDKLEDALHFAEEWYLEQRYLIKRGNDPIGKRVQYFVKSALKAMEADHSPKYCSVLKNYLRPEGRLMRFFGEMPVQKIDSRAWDTFRQQLKGEISEKSIHQLKNAIRLILKQAYIENAIETIPIFLDPMKNKKIETKPRVYFAPEEYETLRLALKRNIAKATSKKDKSGAADLYDYVLFMVHSGLRVGESRELLVQHVELIDDYCRITVAKGKRGGHPPCISFTGAPAAFRRILRRRGISDARSCNEKLFPVNRREAFKKILKENNLYHDAYARRRDFISLRHTYICFRLVAGVSIHDVARNTRTSMQMIDKHYAKTLPTNAKLINRTDWEKSTPNEAETKSGSKIKGSATR